MKSKNLHMAVIIPCLALACLSLVAMGCGTPDSNGIESTVQVTPLKTLDADQQSQKDLAMAAKDKLFAALSSELMTSMGANGPAKSINVCKLRAPEIAAEVSREMGVRIGRTSFKLRNQANVAPEWAHEFVKNKFEKPIDVALPNNELGVLLPIRLQATCTLCHGSSQQVTPDVKAAIVTNYRDDDATGFAEGDVRGYFWVEVPSQNAHQN